MSCYLDMFKKCLQLQGLKMQLDVGNEPYLSQQYYLTHMMT